MYTLYYLLLYQLNTSKSQSSTESFMLSPILNQKKQIASHIVEQYPSFKRESQECMQDQTNFQSLVQQRIDKLNSFISSFSQLRINNNFSHDMNEKLQILSIIQCLSVQISKLQENANRMSSYHRKRDQLFLEREQMVDKITKELRNLENQKQALTYKKENIDRLYKQANERFALQKDDLQKQLRKIQAREKSFQAQLRKRDIQLKSLQEALRKAQQKSQSKTQLFEVVKPFEKDRKQTDSSDSSYDVLTLEKFQDALKKISKENTDLKAFLQKLIPQLNSLTAISQQKLKSLYPEEKTVLKLISYSCFNLPLTYGLPSLEEIIENLKVVEKVIGLANATGHSPQQSLLQNEDQTNWKMNTVINNFKEIVKSQNLILSRTIPNQKNFAQNEVIREVQYCQAVQNYEFQKVKVMIEEQMEQLENKTQSLSKKRQELSNGLMQAEKIKQELMKQKGRLFGYSML